jgi:hypothetical protein
MTQKREGPVAVFECSFSNITVTDTSRILFQ